MTSPLNSNNVFLEAGLAADLAARAEENDAKCKELGAGVGPHGGLGKWYIGGTEAAIESFSLLASRLAGPLPIRPRVWS